MAIPKSRPGMPQSQGRLTLRKLASMLEAIALASSVLPAGRRHREDKHRQREISRCDDMRQSSVG